MFLSFETDGNQHNPIQLLKGTVEFGLWYEEDRNETVTDRLHANTDRARQSINIAHVSLP